MGGGGCSKVMSDACKSLGAQSHPYICTTEVENRAGGSPISFDHTYFYLWGHIKSLVYEREETTCEDLWCRVQDSVENIRNNPGALERVRQSLLRQAAACTEQGGRNCEHLL